MLQAAVPGQTGNSCFFGFFYRRRGLSIAEPHDNDRVTLYRVVDSTETAYLRAHGNIGSNPNRSGKYFAFTLAGARAFATHSMNAGTTITSTTIPQSILAQGVRFADPGQHGAGLS